MKSKTCLRLLAFLPLAMACSASSPSGRGDSTSGGSTGSSGATSTQSGGRTASSGGSSNANGGNAVTNFGGSNSGGGEENCGITTWDLVRKPADVLLVLDRSASMKETPDGGSTPKWDLVIPAVTQVIQETNTAVAWGMKTFPEGDRAGECTATSVTSKIDIEIAPNNATAVVAQIMATNDEGDGTPTGDAIKAAVAYLQGVNDGNPKYILLATDGEPSCDGTTKSTDAARTAAVNAVTMALSQGIPTFVVGVATNKDSATTALNNMAVAGGRPIGGTNPLAKKYYLADTKDTLVTALQTITGEVNKSCVFELNPPPPAPDFIKVEVSGAKVERDPTLADGWEYTSMDKKSLQVYGAACEAIKKAADKVVIKYGCVGITPT